MAETNSRPSSKLCQVHLGAYALTAALILSTGCATVKMGKAPAQADYVLTYLKTGPRSAGLTKEESSTIFGGHMSNMKRLAEEGDLLIAGPFGSPRDKSWRGIFLFNTGDVARAQELVATDPGIVSGVFIAEHRPVRGSVTLRDVVELDRAMLAEQSVKREDPPKNIRAYVMVTAEDGAKAAAALGKSSTTTGTTIWSLRFLDEDGKGGVFVLDAEKADLVDAALEEMGSASGGVWADSWWSTTSLVMLPAEAGKWNGR